MSSKDLLVSPLKEGTARRSTRPWFRATTTPTARTKSARRASSPSRALLGRLRCVLTTAFVTSPTLFLASARAVTVPPLSFACSPVCKRPLLTRVVCAPRQVINRVLSSLFLAVLVSYLDACAKLTHEASNEVAHQDLVS